MTSSGAQQEKQTTKSSFGTCVTFLDVHTLLVSLLMPSQNSMPTETSEGLKERNGKKFSVRSCKITQHRFRMASITVRHRSSWAQWWKYPSTYDTRIMYTYTFSRGPL